MAGLKGKRFPVIDNEWESESFVSLRNFTLMADMQGAEPTGPTIAAFSFLFQKYEVYFGGYSSFYFQLYTLETSFAHGLF